MDPPSADGERSVPNMQQNSGREWAWSARGRTLWSGVVGGGPREAGLQGGRAPAGVSSLFALRQQIHQ